MSVTLLSDPTSGTKARYAMTALAAVAGALDHSLRPSIPCRASSVLQKNTKLYGPMNVLDLESTTSWNSEGTSHQDEAHHWFKMDFHRRVRPTECHLQFQAGFVAETCRIEVYRDDDDEWVELTEVELEDVHETQSFALDLEQPCSALRWTFEDFTDFYGRIIVYQLQVKGSEAEERTTHDSHAADSSSPSKLS